MSLPIGMITCLQEGPLVVIKILGLDLLLGLLMTFWTCSILLFKRFRNVFLIFKVSLTIFFETDNLCWVDDKVAFTYDFFWWELRFFLKYFKISLTSFGVLARIGGGIREMNIGLALSFSLLLVLKFLETQEVNLELTLPLKVLLELSAYNLSQWDS